MKTYYSIDMDGIYSTIRKCDAETNELLKERLENPHSFKTFREAKKELVSNHEYMVQDWKEALKMVRGLKKKNIESWVA